MLQRRTHPYNSPDEIIRKETSSQMTKLIVGNVFTMLSQPTEAALHTVYDCLSYKMENFDIIKKRLVKQNPRLRHWDGTKSFYDTRNRRFLSGFLPRVADALRKDGVPFEISYDEQRVMANWFTKDIPQLKGITLRDYQERAIIDFFTARRGVAKLATGAGKTEIAIAVTAKAAVPTIFLTHRVNLLYQTAKRFANRLPHMANQIGIIGNGQFSPNNITIATVQTIQAMMKKDKKATEELLSNFQLLIIDEAHRSGSPQFYEAAIACKNAMLRLALTATPFMKGNCEDDMYLEGISGNILTNVAAKELIDAGVLARPFFRFIPVNTPLERKLTHWRDIYEHGIVKNMARNKLIVTNALKMVEMGKKTLIIVQEVKHGKIIERVLHDMGVNARYVDGQNSYAERERALKQLEKGKLDTIITTSIFDEGIDVGEIGAVILAAGNKSAPALFQRTGRAIRRKEDENFAIIIDFIDNHHQKLLAHSLRRYELIKNEPGFTIL